MGNVMKRIRAMAAEVINGETGWIGSAAFVAGLIIAMAVR